MHIPSFNPQPETWVPILHGICQSLSKFTPQSSLSEEEVQIFGSLSIYSDLCTDGHILENSAQVSVLVVARRSQCPWRRTPRHLPEKPCLQNPESQRVVHWHICQLIPNKPFSRIIPKLQKQRTWQAWTDLLIIRWNSCLTARDILTLRTAFEKINCPWVWPGSAPLSFRDGVEPEGQLQSLPVVTWYNIFFWSSSVHSCFSSRNLPWNSLMDSTPWLPGQLLCLSGGWNVEFLVVRIGRNAAASLSSSLPFMCLHFFLLFPSPFFLLLLTINLNWDRYDQIKWVVGNKGQTIDFKWVSTRKVLRLWTQSPRFKYGWCWNAQIELLHLLKSAPLVSTVI